MLSVLFFNLNISMIACSYDARCPGSLELFHFEYKGDIP